MKNLSSLLLALLFAVGALNGQSSVNGIPNQSVTTVASPSLYLTPSFSPASQQMVWFASSDALAWKPVSDTFINTADTFFRDGSFLTDSSHHPVKLNGLYYIAHSQKYIPGGTYPGYFQIESTPDFRVFTHVANINIDSAGTYAPEYFQNSDGSIYIYVYGLTNGTMFWIKANDNTMTSWTTAAAVGGLGLGIMDGAMIQIGSYWVFVYTNTAGSVQYVEYATSTTGPTSGFTLRGSQNWAGWGTGLEGAFIEPTASGYRFYMDAGGPGWYAADCTWAPPTFTCGAKYLVDLTIRHSTLIDVSNNVDYVPAQRLISFGGNIGHPNATSTFTSGTTANPTGTVSCATGATCTDLFGAVTITLAGTQTNSGPLFSVIYGDNTWPNNTKPTLQVSACDANSALQNNSGVANSPFYYNFASSTTSTGIFQILTALNTGGSPMTLCYQSTVR